MDMGSSLVHAFGGRDDRRHGETQSGCLESVYGQHNGSRHQHVDDWCHRWLHDHLRVYAVLNLPLDHPHFVDHSSVLHLAGDGELHESHRLVARGEDKP